MTYLMRDVRAGGGVFCVTIACLYDTPNSVTLPMDSLDAEKLVTYSTAGCTDEDNACFQSKMSSNDYSMNMFSFRSPEVAGQDQ